MKRREWSSSWINTTETIKFGVGWLYKCGLWFEWKILITNTVSPNVQRLNTQTTSKRLVRYPISISGSNFLFLSNLSTTVIINWIWFVCFRTTSLLGLVISDKYIFSHPYLHEQTSLLGSLKSLYVSIKHQLTITFYFEQNMWYKCVYIYICSFPNIYRIFFLYVKA